ncbi:trehalose-phosphatase [Yoonia sp.]|uniref:trehalose-phosphatase n=1 Tax=Yoonia sp. TaxID=2212373 RepID=UPI00391B801B
MSHDPSPPHDLRAAQTAFFLDVDGTLAEIVTDPQSARVARPVLDILDRLYAQSGGALALISGRSIDQIDRILSPLRLPAVGVHGLERRLGEDFVTRAEYSEATYADLVASVTEFAQSRPGLQAEPKPGAIALHFRNRPELADTCQQFMREQAAADQQITLMTGKMVLELILGRQTKGDAVASLMQALPFAGRLAFFAGDDVTDESAFRYVNQQDGVSLKIGDGVTCARHRLQDPGAFAHYLGKLVD